MQAKRPTSKPDELGTAPEPASEEDRLRGQTRTLLRLNELSASLWQTASLQAGLEAALSSAIDLVGADKGFIQLLDSEDECLRIAAQQGFGSELMALFHDAGAAHGSALGTLLQSALKRGERLVIADTETDPDFARLRRLARAGGFRSLQATPLFGRDAHPLGVISTHWRAAHRASEIELLRFDLCAWQICDFIARCRADELLRESEPAAHWFAAIVESSDDAIVSKDLNGTIMSWNAGAERLFGYSAQEAIGKSVTMIIPPDRQAEEPHILARIRHGEIIEHYETVRRRKDGMLVDVSLTVSPVKDRRGRIVGASKIARDIGERRRAESHRDLLIGELSHRVKNTLATVLSIARFSFRKGAAIEDGLRSFESRIQALAHTHSHLADARWSGVALADIFEDELSPYRSGSGNIKVSGPPIIVMARHALSLGMAVHELATNAAKYGALSSEGGALAVAWSLDTARDALEICWSETGGPPTAAPESRGFGRLLLERALAVDLGGEVEMDFAAAGLRCTIRIPLAGCLVDRPSGAFTQRSESAAFVEQTGAAPQQDRAPVRILLVEDEYLLASALADDLISAGYSIVGPFAALGPARAGAQNEKIDLAILDVNLGPEKIYPLADELARRKTPFLLLTGYGPRDLPRRFRRTPRLAKPYERAKLLHLIEQLARGEPRPPPP